MTICSRPVSMSLSNMIEENDMRRADIIEQLVQIVVKGSARGNGPAVTRSMARRVVDHLIASDTAPEWGAIREGEETMRKVVAIVRTRFA